MRTTGTLIAGVAAGIGLTVFLWDPRADSPPPIGRPVEVSDAALDALRSALDRARAKAARLEEMLREARRAALRPSRDAAVASEAPAEEDAPPSFRESVDDIREALAAFEEDPECAQLYARHSRDEGALPSSDPERFLVDSTINPRGLELNDEERRLFNLLHARASQRVEVIDARLRVAIAEAVAAKIDDRLDGMGGEDAPPDGDIRVVRLPGSLRFDLSLEECSEITLLENERKLAVFEWLIEAKEFFALIE